MVESVEPDPAKERRTGSILAFSRIGFGNCHEIRRIILKINKPEYPVEILTEIDELNMETRKVHLYPDGHRERADAKNHDADTELSYEPSLQSTRSMIMSQDDFEREWAKS